MNICRNICLSQSTSWGFLQANNVRIGRGVSVPKGKEIAVSREKVLDQEITSIVYDGIDSKQFQVCKPAYVYSSHDASALTIDGITKLFDRCGFALIFRGKSYVKEQDLAGVPSAFISHDSRDKEVAREIARYLQTNLMTVWFDEYSLKPGDRLRRSIEKGLKECKTCILLLSPRFISNPGWTSVEFDSIFARELIEREDRMIPVWLEVSREQVFDYSPSLVDRVALKWDENNALKRLAAAVLARDASAALRKGSR